MCAVDFHSTRSEIAAQKSRSDVSVGDVIELAEGSCPPVVHIGAQEAGGAEALVIVRHLLSYCTLVPQLDQHGAAGLSHRRHASSPSACASGVHSRRPIGAVRRRRVVDRTRFTDDEGDPTVDTSPVVLRHEAGGASVIAPTSLHSRHHEAVAQCDRTHPERREETPPRRSRQIGHRTPVIARRERSHSRCDQPGTAQLSSRVTRSNTNIIRVHAVSTVAIRPSSRISASLKW